MARHRIRGGMAAALLAVAGQGAPTTSLAQFADATGTAGLNDSTESYGASWGDINGDAYLDLYASNHRNRPSLYLNLGDGRFQDMAPQITPWVQFPTRDTHGAAFGDYDNDGDQDFIVSAGAGNPTQVYINNGGALAEQAVELGVDFKKLGGRLPVWLDHNDDQRLDFVMTQFGGVAKLFTQTASGGFVENTTSVGLLCHRFQYGQLFDVDNDGRLDFLCADDPIFPQKIYDTGPDRWVDLAALFPGVEHVADSIAGDFNNDLLMDMFLISNVQVRPSSAERADSRTIEGRFAGGSKGFNFISDGAITIDIFWKVVDNEQFHRIRYGDGAVIPSSVPFTLDPDDPDVVGMAPAVPAGQGPRIRIGHQPGPNRWTIIYDTDPQVPSPEVYMVVTTEAAFSDLVGTGLWVGDRPGQPTLIVNNGASFADGTAAAGLDHDVQCVSATVGDYNNDGDLDLYLACRTGVANLANRYYENQGNGSFVLVPNAAGAAGPVGANITDGAGVAETAISGDYDLDGFLDIFVTNGLNLRPKYTPGGPNKLFRNLGNGNHWIQLDLRGTNSTRDPVGARVVATTASGSQLRVFGSGYHRWAQEPNRMHFGLGSNTLVDLTVHWPSGTTEIHADVAVDRLYRVTEGAGLSVVTPGGSSPPGGSDPPQPGDECFAPTYAAGGEAHLFLWDSCDGSGLWQVRATGGGGNSVYQGSVSAQAPFTSVSPYSLESSDELDTTDPSVIDFLMRVFGAGEDGFSFSFAAGSNPCFDAPGLPAGAQVLVGQGRKPASVPFDLNTFESCTDAPPPPPPSGDCGAPVLDPAADDGIFIWKDCDADDWHVLGLAAAGFKRFIGGISADQAFSNVAPVSLEGNDTLTHSPPTAVGFDLRVSAPWSDGFDFSLPCSAVSAFDLTSPAGVSVHVGQSRTEVGVPFDLGSTAACSDS